MTVYRISGDTIGFLRKAMQLSGASVCASTETGPKRRQGKPM